MGERYWALLSIFDCDLKVGKQKESTFWTLDQFDLKMDLGFAWAGGFSKFDEVECKIGVLRIHSLVW